VLGADPDKAHLKHTFETANKVTKRRTSIKDSKCEKSALVPVVWKFWHSGSSVSIFCKKGER